MREKPHLNGMDVSHFGSFLVTASLSFFTLTRLISFLYMRADILKWPVSYSTAILIPRLRVL